MHILFIARYYYPEKAAAAVCVGEIAKRLLHYGHQVTVLTTVPNYPTGIVAREYRGRLLQTEIIDGVQVIRTWSYASPNRGFFKRILSQLSFGCLAAILSHPAITTPDIIIVASPPLFNMIAAHILAWRTRRPYICWIADLWPASAVELGALQNSYLIRLAEWLEWRSYQRSRLVWVVTEGMRATLIQRGLSSNKVFLLHNGVDTSCFRPQSKLQARQKWIWHDDFVVLYAGTHGLTHGLMTLLDAAEQLRGQIPVRFILVGDGAEKAHLIATARQRQLTNVHFLDPIPHEQMPTLLAASDICLAHTRNLPLFAAMLPIKMFEAMACGRPLLLAVNGEARRIAEYEAQAALYCEPENADALAIAIRHLYTHPEIVQQLGQNGHSYVHEHFDYETLTATLHLHLQHMQFHSQEEG
jgi:colanic acid biosynthesis glycosyl transferase WcaI